MFCLFLLSWCEWSVVWDLLLLGWYCFFVCFLLVKFSCVVIWVWILLLLIIGDRIVLICCWIWFLILLVYFNWVLLRLCLLVLDWVNRCLFWFISVMFFGGRLVMVLEIRCIMVLICFLLSVWLGNRFIVIDVEGDFCLWMNKDGFGIVRCMCVFFIGLIVLMVWESLFFSVCW